MLVNVVAVTFIQKEAPLHASTVGKDAEKAPGKPTGAFTVTVPGLVVAGTLPPVPWTLMACGIPDMDTILVPTVVALKHNSTSVVPLATVVPTPPFQLTTKFPADGFVMDDAPHAASAALKF